MKTLRLLLLTCAIALLGTPAIAQTTVNLAATDSNISETLPSQPSNPGNIRVTRTGATTAALTVWVKISGIAVQNVDFRFANSIGAFVTIPAGSAQLDIPVDPLDDWLIEGTETLRFELDGETSAGTPVPYTVGGNDRVNLNILDNEDPLLPPRAIVTVAVLDAQGAETPPGSNPASFRVSRTNNLTVALDVAYTLGGTAAAGADYVAPSGTVAIPAGVAFADVLIAPIDDSLVENPESVIFTLLPHPSTAVPPPPEAYVLGTAVTASVQILSEDLPPPPSVAITSPASGFNVTSPAATPISIPISFTASDVNGHIVSYTIYDGTRTALTANATYPSPPAPGTPLTVNYTMVNAYGGTHMLRVRVTDNSGVISYSPIVSATVTYIYPSMTVTAVDADAAEVEAGGTQNPAVFAITVDAMPIDQYVFYRLTSPGPGLDFVLPAGYSLANWPIHIFTGPTDYGVAVFPAGTTRVEIAVTPVDDLHLEGSETLTITLSYPFVIDERTFEGIVQFTEGGFHVDPNAIPVVNFQYEIGTVRTATATIADNDTVPAPFSIVTIAATDSDAQETAPSATANPGVFTITRVGPTTLPLTVNYAITAPPRPTVITSQVAVAQNGVDFTTIGSSATIPAGASSVDIVIAPIYDLLAEPSELLQVSLRPPTIPLPSPSSYMLGAGIVASLAIVDAKLPAGTPVVWITASDSRAYELGTAPSRTASLLVQRNGNLTDSIAVTYTIGGNATNGVDYIALPGLVTIPAGSANAQIVVTPIDDFIEENVECVSLTLQTPPLEVEPPAYALGSTSSLQRSAGIAIRDIYVPALTRQQRALRIRFPNRYAGFSRPLEPNAPGTPPPPPGAAPAGYKVEATTNLVNWEEIGTIGPDEESDDFVDVEADNYESRFYRFSPIPVTVP